MLEEETNTTDTQETPNPAESENTAVETEKETDAEVSKEKETEEVSDKKESQEKITLPKSVKKELWSLRKQRRELAEELKRRKSQETQTTSETTDEGEVSPLDDPEKWEETLLKKAEDRLLEKMQTMEMQKKVEEETQKAEEYLTSLPEMDDEKAREELSEILTSPFYDELKKVYPLRAVKLAVMEWKNNSGLSRETPPNDSGIKTTATKSSGKKVWSRAEIEKALSDFNNPKYAEIEAEIDLAIKEGRVK